MGVLPCYRSNCSNIMCDTYIYDVGYICNSCQEEFLLYLSREPIVVPTNDDDIVFYLKRFLKTPVGIASTHDLSFVREFFDKHRNDW